MQLTKITAMKEDITQDMLTKSFAGKLYIFKSLYLSFKTRQVHALHN